MSAPRPARATAVQELVEMFSDSIAEAADGSWFVCCRCRRTVGADFGCGDLEGLCDDCWCTVQPLVSADEQARAAAQTFSRCMIVKRLELPDGPELFHDLRPWRSR